MEGTRLEQEESKNYHSPIHGYFSSLTAIFAGIRSALHHKAVDIRELFKELRAKDDAIEDLVQEYKEKHLQMGWSIFSSIFLFLIGTAIVFILLLASPDHPIRVRAHKMVPLFTIII